MEQEPAPKDRHAASSIRTPGGHGSLSDSARRLRRTHRVRALRYLGGIATRPTSMHRYYMTPETRQAVIAESNRLIATRAARAGRDAHRARAGDEDTSFGSETGADWEATSDSAFARLVAELESSSSSSASDAAAPS